MRNKLRVRWLYWRQVVWFYVWKWSMPVPWLHARTIRGVNQARFDYFEGFRKWWPKSSAGTSEA